jgi:hypothetical protein
LSGESSIRIRNKDRELIRKLNNRVYSKKSRLKKLDLLPDIQTKGITEFETRKEFNAYVKEMEAFTSRQNQYTRNEKGATLPVQTLQNIEKEIARINKEKLKRKEMIEERAFTFAGEETGMKAGERLTFIKERRFESLIPLKFNPDRYRNISEMEKHLEQIRKSHKGDFLKEKDTLYKKNYLQAIANVHGDESQLYKIVKRMPLAKFIQFYYTETLAEMTYIYDKVLRNEIHDMLVQLYKS